MEPSRPFSGSFTGFSSHIMEALFFSMGVYETTQEAVLFDIQRRFGKVEPLIGYGFEDDGMQAIFAGRSQTGRIIVACRGTAGFRDIVQDLKYLQSRLSFVKGAAAHWGFAERAEGVPIDFFCKLLSAGEEIIFAGHSLGGAVASLLTLRILESSEGRFDKQVHCITFGCPLFASCRLADLINFKYKDVFTHIVSRRDVVPKILPFISTLQKLVYADEDHLEGLFVLKKMLELLPGIPVGSLISGIESKIPWLFKFLFRGFMKLALPSGMTGSYAFAGHIVMLDTEGLEDRSLVLASADDMNVWHSQLGLAFGAGFDVTMIEQHMLQCYHNGILRALLQVRVQRNLAYSLTIPRHSVTNKVGHCTDTSVVHNSLARSDIVSDVMQEQQSIVVRVIPPESSKGGHVVNIQVRWDSEDGKSSSIIVKKSAFLSKEDGQESTACSTTLAVPIGVRASTTLTRTMSEGKYRFVRPLSRSGSWKMQKCISTNGSSAVWTSRSEVPDGGAIVRTQELAISCRACSHLREHMDITTCCHRSPRRGVGFGWFLGTIGRVARHLRVLDNLCYLTFVRIVVANLVG